MDLPQKRLRTNHGNERPRKILFIDSETRSRRHGDDELHTMRIAWTAYWSAKRSSPWENLDWRLWKKTYPLNRYINGAVGEKECLWIVGHNIFYDLQACDFYYYFPRWGWELVFTYDTGLTYILVIRQGKRTIKCISTTNYFDYGLSVLGSELGLPKQSVEFHSVGLARLIGYCRRDVEIVIAAMQQFLSFIDMHDCGAFGLSRAGQSFNAYRHRYLREPIYIHQVDKVKDLERDGYHGGRCEAFRLGSIEGGPFIFFDIHSMYPYLMRNLTYPVQLVGYRDDLSPGRLAELMGRHAAVARVIVETPTPWYAVQDPEKIVFPTGRFETVLCTGGILKALEAGHLVEVREASFYRSANLFGDYVDYFYPLKVQAQKGKDEIRTRFTKIFLNSLYGKFGQKRYITYSEPDPGAWSYNRVRHVDLVTGMQGIEYHLFNRVVYQLGQEDTAHTFTAIAGHVTEYGRLLLYSIIDSIGRDRVIYCDTDSVVIRKKDLPRVRYPMSKYALGSLGIERRCDRLAINSAKDYEVDRRRIVKGVPKNARYIGANTYEYQQFLGQIMHMNAEQDRGVLIRNVTKTVEPSYDKGVLMPNGSVDPFIREA